MQNNYTYRLVDDGYYILNNGRDIIEQRGAFADVILPGQPYEENAVAHIAQLIEAENNSNAQAEEYEQLKKAVEEVKENSLISLLAITEIYETTM